MTHSARAVLLVAALCALSPRAEAQADDPRIRTVTYDPARVIPVVGHFDFQMMVEFSPDERIENVSIGDALSWQVIPNKTATLLFLKPVSSSAVKTNMTVVTDRRRYLFELTAREAPRTKGEAPVYALRFTYPAGPSSLAAAPMARPAPERRNAAYTYTGSVDALPALVFDDGAFTYFQWPDAASMPALFLLQADGSEAIVNYAYRDGFLVVEQVAPRFLLRNGSAVTTIINEGWQTQSRDAAAPQPADVRTARAAGAPPKAQRTKKRAWNFPNRGL